jgi:hypothetical protein
MLLDQSSTQLLRTHFLGKDGFVWWIGQVALPTTSRWNESNLPNKVEGVELYYNRVKVRIFGYHTGNCSELPDDKLPWAHILIPPGESNGVGKQGKAHNYQGGETVIGFFLDGDDAQQPVIFGSLYKSAEIKSISVDEVASKLCSEFKPFDPNPPKLHNSLSPKTPGGQNVGTGRGDINSQGQPAKSNKSGIDNISSLDKKTTPTATILFAEKLDNKSAKPTLCNDNSFNKIAVAIDRLLKKIKNYQNIANNYYYDKVRNKITNFQGEVRKIASLISADVSVYIKNGMNFLFEELSKKLGLTFGGLFPKTKQSQIGKQIDEILEKIYCAFKKIGFSLFDLINEALDNFIGNAIGATICVIQNFLGQLLSKILATIESVILPLLDSLNALFQNALGSVTNLLSNAMNLLGLIEGLLSCANPSKYCDTPQTFSIAQGIDIGLVSDVAGLVNSVGNIGGLIENAGDILSVGDINLDENGCLASSRVCGPPKIVILGGGGSGATANAVVNNNGEVIGAIVTNTGSNYIEPPVVSIIDPCENGQGARATAILGNVPGGGLGVIFIVIDNPGDGYLNREVVEKYGDEDEDFGVNPNIDTIGDSYVSIVESAVIKNPGYGYDENTKVKIGNCETKIEIGPGGSIIGITVEAGCFVDEIPPVTINSENGAAAVILPVLGFNKVGIGSTFVGTVIKVIDCVQK